MKQFPPLVDGGDFLFPLFLTTKDLKKFSHHNLTMDSSLQEYADTVKDQEYKDLFPEQDVQEIKENPGKVKEALFQVHHMIYDEQLHKILDDNISYRIPLEDIEKVLSEKDFERLEKLLGDHTGNLVSKDKLRNVAQVL